jgi:hypothetical protein
MTPEFIVPERYVLQLARDEMTQQIMEWIQAVTRIPGEFSGKIISSLVVILLLLLLRTIVLKAVWRKTDAFQVRYRWRKISNYVVFFLTILFLGRVWLEVFQSVATFLGLLSAGLALALKDPIVNLAGLGICRLAETVQCGGPYTDRQSRRRCDRYQDFPVYPHGNRRLG